MKRIMSILAVTVTAACLTLSAAAQDSSRRGPGGPGGGRRTPEERAKMQTEQMVKDLGLNAEQTTKVDSINLVYAKQGGGMRGGGQQGGGDVSREEMMKQYQKTQDERNAAYKAVLTEKQYADFIKAQEEQRKRMAERMQNRQQ